MSRSGWPCGRRSRPAGTPLLVSRVRILLRPSISSLVFVCCVGSGLCDGLITRSEESPTARVSNCVSDMGTSAVRRPGPEFGLLRHRDRKVCVKTS